MKMVKNIAIFAFATSFMFASVGFHYANNYSNMDAGTDVTTSWGVTYDLNDNTSIGWDSAMGMQMSFDAPLGVALRLGWTGAVTGSLAAVDDRVAQTSVGLGFTWWTGGEGVKTSISTNFDYVMAPGSDMDDEQVDNTSNLSVVVGFGF